MNFALALCLLQVLVVRSSDIWDQTLSDALQEDFAEGHLELLQWRGQTLTESEQVSGTNPKHAETETEDVKVAGAMQSTAYAVDIAEEELKPKAQGGADSDKADFRGHKAPTGSSTAFHQTHRPSDR
mmetsp:Transcript_116532/g.163846  ORF Transcript_116532/g.163846 Transcript_116532/m.163846 type:complete len:127 (+) Transcript_116532:88-468(+)